MFIYRSARSCWRTCHDLNNPFTLQTLLSPFCLPSFSSSAPPPFTSVCVYKCNYRPCHPSRQYGGVHLYIVTSRGGQSDNLASRRIWFHVKLKTSKKKYAEILWQNRLHLDHISMHVLQVYMRWLRRGWWLVTLIYDNYSVSSLRLLSDPAVTFTPIRLPPSTCFRSSLSGRR